MIFRKSKRALRLAGLILAMVLLASSSSAAPQVRLKDIADLSGVRENQLIGYGIVVGLAGTGDSNKSVFTVKSVVTALERMGVNVDNTKLDLPNIAAVIVTASLPPYASSGMHLDVTVSSIGDATSLRGGVLLQTPLKAADGNVYAVVQGNISLSGAGLGDQRGGGGQKGGFTTVGRVDGGALVEREIVSEFVEKGKITYLLRRPDFTTASRAAAAINEIYEPDVAVAENAERIRVTVPSKYVDHPVDFIARLEEVTLQPDASARVVINERTGTVVFGEEVAVSSVAVSHGSLSLTVKPPASAIGAASLIGASPEIAAQQRARQAALASEGERVETTVSFPDGASVRDVVRALNSVGAKPADIIAILQAIKEAGALHAELELM